MVARRQKPIYAFIDSQNLNLGPNQYKYSALLRRFVSQITFLNTQKIKLATPKTKRGGH